MVENGLEDDLDERNVVNLRTKATKLKTYEEQITMLDQEILDLIMQNDNVNDEEYQNEAIAIDEYMEKVFRAKIRIDVALEDIAKRERSVDDDFQSMQSTSKKRYKLPKIELQKFSGNVIDWLSWWALFEKIDDDDELNDADKFQYLLQSVEEKSRAYDIIKAFPASAANYPKAVSALKERFGNKNLLTQVYIRELFQMGLKNLQEKPEISSLYDKLVGHVRSLETLGVTVEQATLFLFPMVEASLPEDVMIAWQRSSLYDKDGTQENPAKGKLDYLLEFLRLEVEREDQRRLVKSGFLETKENHKQVQKKKEPVATAAGLHVGNTKLECIFCGKRHLSQDCYTAKNMALENKWNIIKQKKICGRCLKGGHLYFKCKESIKCPECSKKHYPILCAESSKNEKVMSSNSGSNNVANSIVLLKTILVVVDSADGPITVRALFDDGSHRSYITSSLAQKIKGKQIGKFFERNTLFGGILSDIEERTIYEISVRPINGKTTYKLEIADKQKITGEIQKLPKGSWLGELKQQNIWINDYSSNSEEPDILIGADLMPKLTTDISVTLHYGLKAMKTVFGWTIMGPIPQINQTCLSIAMTVTNEQINDATIKHLWDLETIGIRDPVHVQTIAERNQLTKEHFERTVNRNADGRYQIALPWANGMQIIPSNFNTAMKRLNSLTKKLKEKSMFTVYENIFKQWAEEQFFERVEKDDPLVVKYGHYIPHQAVFKPESKTTPVRPVFDASCKIGRHPSLNECLEKGPNLIELLPTSIIRFREKLIGVLADIRKAFQMIEVQEKDQYFLLFIWWEDESCEKIVIYKHNRVVFGLKSSPFILAAVIEFHLDNVREEDRVIAAKLKNSFYVDNCVTSVESWDEFLNFKSNSIRLMADARMDLREWEHTLLSFESECGNTTHGQEVITSVLGLKWNKTTDTLSCGTFPVIPDKLSKRTLLSTINMMFDPMGMLSPAMVFPKIMLQSAWKEKLDWDDELPQQLKLQLNKWYGEVHHLADIKIPRFLKGEHYSTRSKEQLHVFCDASQLAYAAAVFLRIENDNDVTVQLIQSKSRVAPINKVTMPRMELIGCTIGARLSDSVQKALELPIPCFYWSDSTTALSWIKRNDDWGTFVGNRVREILTLSPADHWNYVPGKLNPADLPSCGCSPKQLLDSIWWEGPQWLKRPQSEWPNQEFSCNEDEINVEQKKSNQVVLNNIPTIIDLPWFAKSSSYIINLRRIALLQRFIHNSLAKKNGHEIRVGYLKGFEINEAETKMVKLVQDQVFPSKAEFIAGLRVEKEKNMYYVVTKIMNRQDTGRFTKPWLLPSNHPIVTQLIIEEHLKYGHAGPQFIASKLREKFWIIHTKTTVTKVIQKCTICIRHRRSTVTVPASPLPENRVNNAKVFEIIGVDLAGPLYLRDDSKQWVVLFTCAVMRAIHLELVDKIDTTQFILALGRFIYKRGRPSIVYADNGLNFRGTANLFGKLNWDKIQSKFMTERITWIFNPPAAPWWGGFWERMVRSLKEYLRKILGHNKLTKVELDTAICFVESLINGRPLTHLSENPDDLLPISPSAFIQDIQSSEYPEIEEITGKKVREKLRHLNQLKQELRDRFRSEYLGQLVQRSKTRKDYTFQIGEMVLIEMEDKKRIDWPLARITELIPGNDKKVRVAKLKTAKGQLVRALNRLVPMELGMDENLPIDAESKKKARQINEEPAEIPEIKKRVRRKGNVIKEKVIEEVVPVTTRSGRQVKAPTRLQL